MRKIGIPSDKYRNNYLYLNMRYFKYKPGVRNTIVKIIF